MVKAKPDGYHTATPHITVKDASKAIDYYKKAFGAQVIVNMPGPGGKGVMHAEIKIGDSVIMLGEEMPGMAQKSPQSLGGVTSSLYLYVDDADSVYNKAVSSGGTARGAMQDMFWGDRVGRVADPFGQEWSIATHKEDVSADEMKKRSAAFMAKMSATG